jgi:hypothetical protein
MILLELISAWFLGILTISMTNDNKAITQCRMILLDLEKELENLKRTPQWERANSRVNKIRKIKDILRNLNMQHAGLSIKINLLQNLIDESLGRIRDWEINPNEPENALHCIIVDLCSTWGLTGHTHEATKIKEIRIFIHAGFLKRLWFKIVPFKKIFLITAILAAYPSC